MHRPVTAPVIIQTDLDGLEALLHAVRKQFLNTRVLGKGNMWTNVEQEPALAVWPP